MSETADVASTATMSTSNGQSSTQEDMNASNDRMSAAVAAMVAGDEAAAPAETEATETETAPEEAVETEATPEAKPAAEKKAEAAPEGEKKEAAETPELPSTALSRIARREKRQREQHEARLAEIDVKMKELESKASGVSSLDDLKALADSDPVALFAALGIKDKLADKAKSLYYEELGEDAPAEAKENRRIRQLEAEIRAVKRETTEWRNSQQQAAQQVANQQLVDKYVNTLELSLSEVPAEFKHVVALAKNNRQGAVQAMYQMAVSAAEANPQAEIASPAELIEALEENILGELAQLGYTNDSPKKTTETEQKKTSGKTLTNKQVKDQTKPKPAAMTDEERLRNAEKALVFE